jgi:type IV / VI secretion system protein, DotU family
MSDINGPDDEDSMSDRTIVRPRGVPTAANPPPPAATAPPPAAPSPTPPRPTTQTDISAFLHGGMNPLVQLASPLLLLAVQLRHSVDLPDMPRLREQTVAQVRKFEQEAQTAGISTQTITAARYVLCTMLDESILNAPWGEQSGWAQKTLLVTFHRESYGGAKFFQILERLLADFSRHIDLIEMMYVCLVLGFGGRYAIESGGRARLAEIQDDLYRRLRAQRTAPAEELSPHWHGIQDRRNPLIRYVPLWVVGAAAACILLGVFLFFFVRLNDTISPVSARLSEIGLESAVPPDMANFARMQPVVVHKTLRQLLAAEIQAGQLAVIEKKAGREIVRIGASAMFPSGSIIVSPQELPLLKKIALALNQLHGRVIVVGYTNSVPIHTFRFPNNFVLSKARARAVESILDKWIDNPGRLEYVGAGDTHPIALPTTRAVNRRIEITYIPEG